MSRTLFRSGGPLHIQSLGPERYRATITLPKDEDGRIARECPQQLCAPGYFKVMPGTGITSRQTAAFCPYCRAEAKPDDFSTKEQARYAKELVMREARAGVDDMIRDAFGLDSRGKRKMGGGFVSMEVSLKTAPQPFVRPPFEEEVRRDVVCPHCTLDQTVFGLATWCADCGADVFPVHVSAELNVVRRMIDDIERRREVLGRRVAAKDLENCLEDVVSIFEASMKAMTHRYLRNAGTASEDIDSRLKRFGNAFQNIPRTQELMKEILGIDSLPDVRWASLQTGFEKRHPITHNLGVIDRKYLEKAHGQERHGREVRVGVSEVESLIEDVLEALSAVHRRLFGCVGSATSLGSVPDPELDKDDLRI